MGVFIYGLKSFVVTMALVLGLWICDSEFKFGFVGTTCDGAF